MTKNNSLASARGLRAQAYELNNAADEMEAGFDETQTCRVPTFPLGGVALVVGHTRRAQGAYSPYLAVCEYEWNLVFAQLLKAQLEAVRVRACVFTRDKGGIRGAYNRVKSFGPQIVLELHFNSAAGMTAYGAEVVVADPQSYPTFFGDLVAGMAQAIRTRNRGVKVPWEGRGGLSLRQTSNIPHAICEPFFGSYDGDARGAEKYQDDLANNMTQSVLRYLEGIKFDGGQV